MTGTIATLQSPTTILFFAANPTDCDYLRLDHEARQIDEQLASAVLRDCFKLQTRWATRPLDLINALNDHRPGIVHFGGHGGVTGIVLESALGRSRDVGAGGLCHIFATVKDEVRCVVLNACSTDAHARALAQLLEAAIGMTAAISDAAATVFSSTFYRSLASGRSLASSYEQAIAAMVVEGTGQDSVPRLYGRSDTNLESVLFASVAALPKSTATITVILDSELREIDAQKIGQLMGELRKSSGDLRLEIGRRRHGSVRLSVHCTRDGAAKLLRLHALGELIEVRGLRVLGIEPEEGDWLASDLGSRSLVASHPSWSDHRSKTVVGVTLLYHPNLNRVGEVAVLMEQGAVQQALLGRSAPVFRNVNGVPTDSLAVAELSNREPLRISGLPSQGLRLEQRVRRMEVIVDGRPLTQPVELSFEQLERGVVLVLGGAVALLLHAMDLDFEPLPELGFVGASRTMRRLRAEILRVADLDSPVLVCGETGVGKELVAAALHACGARKDGPLVRVNVAAIPSSLAEAELFGYARGALAGAVSDRAGHVELADGGTLFLNEIDQAPPAVQDKLIHFDERKEVRPLGGAARTADVRIVAGSDSDLERAVVAGIFRRSLFERLSRSVLHVPSLRARREDIPRLFLHFLEQELVFQHEQGLVASSGPGARPTLPLPFMLRLVAHDWPGNVRELQNTALRVAFLNRTTGIFGTPQALKLLTSANVAARPADATQVGAAVPEQPRAGAAEISTFPGAPGFRKPVRALSDADVVAALDRNGFNVSRTARELGVSRTALHTRMDACRNLQNPADMSDVEIQSVLAECGNDLTLAGARLRVSHRALLLRMQRLKRA